MLSDDELERYARHIILRDVGGAGQAKLKAAQVAVIGAGGIGCPALQYLAAAGVGKIAIFDDDVVALSNLQRQVLFGAADIGRPKVEAAADALQRVNPWVVVEPHPVRLTAQNAAALLTGHDVIIDGTDSFVSRLAVADAAQTLHIPLVSAAVGTFEGQLAVYRGWESDKPCYRCLVGAPDDRAEESCADQGILGAVPGVIGSLAAVEALRAITGFGDDPAGTLQIMDFMTLRWRSIRVPKDPGCRCAG